MGFIPIFIALLGLVLLYSIYTYNQIKPRKARLNQVIEQMAANSGQRKMAIFAYDSNNAGSSLAAAAAQLKKTSTDTFQSFKKEEELVQLVSESIRGLSDKEVKRDLEKANETQQVLIKKLKSYANDYNSHIAKAPASFVATAFGFKPF